MRAILKLIEGDQVKSEMFEAEMLFIHTRDGNDLWSLQKRDKSDEGNVQDYKVIIFFNKTVFHSVEFKD